jgi:glycosyltransferase involved in cell wall biosynthesis
VARPRIGFDVAPLVAPPGVYSAGVVRACAGLVAALEARGVIELVRLAPEPGLEHGRWRQRRLPSLVHEQRLAGVHSPVSAFALRGPGARVQTLHELPWRNAERENADLRHRFWAVVGPWRADAVLCPSAATARALSRGRGRVHVCPWGIGPPFEPEPAPGVVDEVALGRYRLGADPLALCLGAVRPKKNLAAVLRGLAEYRQRGGRRVQLVVSGEHTAQLRRDLGLASQLGLAGWVSTPGTIEEAQLTSLLRLASVVPVLSRSEGFAFPVLEALACGTPVLVPAGSAQAELAGDAGIAVEPEDPASVARGFERALAEREALRGPLAERARAFTWQRCAEQVESLWSRLA